MTIFLPDLLPDDALFPPCLPAIAGIAQLGERQTEDLKVAGSIPAVGIRIYFLFSPNLSGVNAAD